MIKKKSTSRLELLAVAVFQLESPEQIMLCMDRSMAGPFVRPPPHALPQEIAAF